MIISLFSPLTFAARISDTVLEQTWETYQLLHVQYMESDFWFVFYFVPRPKLKDLLFKFTSDSKTG